MAQGGIDSTQQIQTLTPELQKIKKKRFSSQEAQFSDKKSKIFVIMFAILIFNQFEHKSRTVRSDRFAFYVHNVNKRLIAVTRHRSWRFIQ